MTVQIRPLHPDDVAASHQLAFTTFAELDARAGDPVAEHTDEVRSRGEARIRHLLATDPDGAWVAEERATLVGVALALRREALWFLSLLTVAPPAQGAGTGRLLLDAALRTAHGARAAFLMSSSDPRALRRYASAGFTLHPGYDARGTVDRSALPADRHVRDGDLLADADLVDEVVVSLRGATRRPDSEAWAGTGVQVVIGESGRDRGFCVWAPGRVISAGATAPELAQRLLWAGLGRAGGEVELGFVTADQQWAVPVLLGARLALKPGSSSVRRGALGPLTPYLPSGGYG